MHLYKPCNNLQWDLEETYEGSGSFPAQVCTEGTEVQVWTLRDKELPEQHWHLASGCESRTKRLEEVSSLLSGWIRAHLLMVEPGSPPGQAMDKSHPLLCCSAESIAGHGGRSPLFCPRLYSLFYFLLSHVPRALSQELCNSSWGLMMERQLGTWH